MSKLTVTFMFIVICNGVCRSFTDAVRIRGHTRSIQRVVTAGTNDAVIRRTGRASTARRRAGGANSPVAETAIGADSARGSSRYGRVAFRTIVCILREPSFTGYTITSSISAFGTTQFAN